MGDAVGPTAVAPPSVPPPTVAPAILDQQPLEPPKADAAPQQMPAQKVGEDTTPAPAVPADATAAAPAAEEGEQAKEPLAPIPERMTDQTKSKILNQIEFYFSESNLPKDKFLRELVSKDEDGKVEVAILCFFMNIRKLLKPCLKGTDLKIPPAAGGALKHKAEVPAEICQAIVDAIKIHQEWIMPFYVKIDQEYIYCYILSRYIRSSRC